jgi:hypothetical protein
MKKSILTLMLTGVLVFGGFAKVEAAPPIFIQTGKAGVIVLEKEVIVGFGHPLDMYIKMGLKAVNQAMEKSELEVEEIYPLYSEEHLIGFTVKLKAKDVDPALKPEAEQFRKP